VETEFRRMKAVITLLVNVVRIYVGYVNNLFQPQLSVMIIYQVFTKKYLMIILDSDKLLIIKYLFIKSMI
jgi:hypothetical protein